MAGRVLQTDWKRIGRSGPTVDGRNIDPKIIDEMAASYNKDLYTALIWPEHQRYVNYGTVEALRSEANEEGGKDLFAIISPNEFYTGSNHYGQKLFTSMEITVDFRKSGKAYLTGLGATDDPASAATSEIRLSAARQAGIVESDNVEAFTKPFEQVVQPSLFEQFKELFTKSTEGQDMAEKAEIEKLNQGLAELKAMFAKLPQTEAGAGAKPEEKPSDLAVVLSRLDSLEEKFSALQKDGGDKATVTPEDFNAFKEKLEAFGNQLADALKEQPGTQAGEHFGATDADKKHIY